MNQALIDAQQDEELLRHALKSLEQHFYLALPDAHARQVTRALDRAEEIIGGHIERVGDPAPALRSAHKKAKATLQRMAVPPDQMTLLP
jgi:hypothetical protein